MSQHNTQESKANMPEADDIAEYLRKHPEFFEQHPEVLADINISHRFQGAVSLVERQVKNLREQNYKFKHQLDELIAIARENDVLNERVHRLTLGLLDAKSINDVYIALDDALRGDMQADAIAVKLFIDADAIEIDHDNELMQTIFVHMDDPQMEEYKTILSHEKPSCGPLKPEQTLYIFGKDMGADIESAALIPIGGDSCTDMNCPFLGMIAIGSEDPQRFHASMGTMFLSNLGEIVSRIIKSHLSEKKQD